MTIRQLRKMTTPNVARLSAVVALMQSNPVNNNYRLHSAFDVDINTYPYSGDTRINSKRRQKNTSVSGRIGARNAPEFLLIPPNDSTRIFFVSWIVN